MPRLDSICNLIHCSRIRLYRILILLGLIAIGLLLTSKNDLSTTVSLPESVLTPFIRLSGGKLLSTSAAAIQTVTTTASTPALVTTTTTTTTTATRSSTLVTNQNTVSNSTNTTSSKNDTNMSQQPKEAFVTFSNNQPAYLAVLKVLLDSVHAFSTRPIIAFGIDVDLEIDEKQYPRAIKRRISQADCGPSVYFCKIHAIVSSNVDYGVLMETDDVVNYNIDVLFDVLHVWDKPYPLSPRHPDDPQNYDHFLRQFNVSKRTTPYIHAHMIWNYHSIPFLTNLRSILRQGGFQGANFDETAVNVMLWKANATYTLCKYDPYFTYSESYLNWPTITNCTRYCHTVFVTMHGCKEGETSAALLKKLQANIGKPAVQTLGMGGMKHINDTSVTCCYPDSKPSPIHPLLCEHLSV